MRFLVVRSRHYLDPRERALIKVVDELWNLLEVPPLTKVVTKDIPKVWWSSHPRKSSFHYARYWLAWEEWKLCPAHFLIVVDADIIPTNKKSLVNLCNFLNQIPQHIGIVTRESVNLVESVLGRRLVHLSGVGFMPSEGISVWQEKFIPSLFISKCFQYLWISSPFHAKWYSEIDYSEGIYTCGLPPIPMVTFPEEILIIVGTDMEVKEDTFETTNFIHPAGHIASPQYAKLVFTALQRTIEGRF